MSRSGKLIALVFAIFCLGLLVMVAWVSSSPKRITEATTYSAAPEGCKAFYLLLRQMNLPVERLKEPLSRLKGRDGVLIVVQPRRVAYSSREISKLKDWVRQGNRLLVIDGAAPSNTVLLPQRRSESQRGRRSLLGITAGFPLQDIGLKFKTAERYGRSAISLETLPKSFSSNESWSPPRVIEVARRSRWNPVHSDWESIASDGSGPAVVERKLGSGRILAVCDGTFAGNQVLSRADNVTFLLAFLLADGPPERILFDEYHHGYEAVTGFRGYVSGTVFPWILLQAAVGFVLLSYSRRASYAGRMKSTEESTGRSSLEYVQSLADIFASCSAYAAAMEAVVRRRLHRIPGARALGPDSIDRELIERLTGGVTDEEKQLGRVLDEYRDAVKWGVDGPKAVRIARGITELTDAPVRPTGRVSRRP